NKGKGDKDRIVPFPQSFRELLAMHMETMRKENARYLFESNWKKKYTDRGVRKILSKYSEEAGLSQSLFPHRLRHFLLTSLKKIYVKWSTKYFSQIFRGSRVVKIFV